MKKDRSYFSYITIVLVLVLVWIKHGGHILIRWLPFLTIFLAPLMAAFIIRNYSIDKKAINSYEGLFRKKMTWLASLFLISILFLLLLTEFRLLGLAMLGALGMSLVGLLVYKLR
jgi:ACR3 family arsenite efflux pump ArsB